MALIFDDASLDGRQFGYLMPLQGAGGLYLLDLPRQGMAAVLALLRQDGPHLIHSLGGRQWAMRSAMAGLSTHLPPALLAPAPLSRFACQSIGGRRFGGIRGVLLAQRQLPLQVGDLLFGVGDLLIPFGYLTAEFFKLSLQPLIFTLQLPTAGLGGVPRAIRRCRLLRSAASRSRTHPPYGKRFGEICPEKSTEVPELLRFSLP
jgi:hypothetical protein